MSSIASVWIQPSFLKDAKLRVRERYWREFELDSTPELLPSVVILPDALSWRKYLRLIQLLLGDENNSNSIKPTWYLIESVAEYMDHRNQAPCWTVDSGVVDREPSAPQERIILQRLVRDGRVKVFCDASVRCDPDEWDDIGMQGMTVEERSRHALVRAADMIHASMEENAGGTIPIWLLCSEENHLPLSEACMTCADMPALLRWLIEQGHLSGEKQDFFAELTKACEIGYDNRIKPVKGGKDYIRSYSTEAEIQSGLADGRLLRGRLVVTKENPREAFVSVKGEQLFIDGQKGHFDHAIHQDVVVIEALNRSEWGRPVGRRRLVHHSEVAEDEGGPLSLYDDPSIPPIPSACVVAVDRPGRRMVVATMVDLPSNDESAILVIPMDIRIPKIRIRTRSWNAYQNARLKVSIDGWEPGSKYPHGRCVEVLGPIGDLETEIKALLLENEIELEPFSLAAQACLPLQGDQWVVSEQEAIRRKDMRRSRRIFSVDPPGCQDIDDTMHAERLANGDIEGKYSKLIRFCC
jgi:hypothetical protein